MKDLFITIIIPCYNEEKNLRRDVLGEVEAYLSKVNFKYEVLISNDGSTDNSLELVKKSISDFRNFFILNNPHGGKPSALKYGIEKARGDYVLFTDMDQSTPIDELEKLLPFVDQYDVIIGSRGLNRKDFPLYRKLGALVFGTFRRMLILPEITDTQCGFKLFKTDLIKKVFPRLEFFRKQNVVRGWTVSSWDVEFLHMVKKKDVKIKEVVVEWKDRDVSTSKGGSLEKYFKESKEMFKQILRVKINDLRGFYENI